MSGKTDPGRTGRDVFASTILNLEPYASEIVLIGGWVHELYLREGGHNEQPVRTDDVDYTLPKRLEKSGRPLLVDLAKQAGFEIDSVANDQGIRLVQDVAGISLDLDFIADGDDPTKPVEIDGQSGLLVQGYPFQNIMLENTRWIYVGPEIHPSLEPPRRIRIPTVGAYVLHKGISSGQRTRHRKKAKDLVYLFEIIRHPSLRTEALGELNGLATRYPDAYQTWRDCLENVVEGNSIRSDVAEQVIEGSTAWIGDRLVGQLRSVRQRNAFLAAGHPTQYVFNRQRVVPFPIAGMVPFPLAANRWRLWANSKHWCGIGSAADRPTGTPGCGQSLSRCSRLFQTCGAVTAWEFAGTVRVL